MTATVSTQRLKSERVVIAAPLSLAGSAGRIWRLTRLSTGTPQRIGLITVAVLLVALAWALVLAWYLLWGLLLVQYRILRRGARKRKREALMHREQLAAIEATRQSGA